MHFRGPTVAFLLAALILTIGLIVGCGGGDQSGAQQGNGSQAGGAGGAKKQDGEGAKPKISAPRIALGTVARVNTEVRMIFLRPTAQEQGKKPLRFRVRKDATITLNDEGAELSDAEKGQSAQITYVVRTDPERNIAREVSLISDGGGSGGGEETG